MQKHQWRQHGIVHFKSRPTPESTPGPEKLAVASATATATVAPRQVKIEPPRPLVSVRPAPPTSYTALVDSMKARREESPFNRSVLDPGNPPEPPIAHQQNHLEVPKYANIEPEPQQLQIQQQPHLDYNKIQQQQQQQQQQALSEASTPVTDQTFSYSSMLNETTQPNSHLLIVQTEQEEQQQQQQQQAHLPPIKLKMKMAYQREQQVEHQQHEQKQVEIKTLDCELNEMKIQQTTETVDCQCKTCGNTFSVVDPYNFKCNNCHVKYTSLPTHLIADPLQCIGCCAVFPHKPALKSHQMVPDKERPFRCCKCGYGFR